MVELTIPLVSIMVPVYQGENYIARCLESVLSQTHKNIQLIIVDDGSTDQTAKIVSEYISIFKDAGMTLIYKNQNNAGQAAAISTALKEVVGDYIAWFDSDDILLPNFVEDLLNCMLFHNTNYSIGQLEIVDESNVDKVLAIKKRVPPQGEDCFFEDLLLEKNILYGNGSVMVKTKHLFSRLQNKSIYESKEGQNWQIMLPITYKEKCAYLDRPVSKQVVRKNSHSRQKRSFEQLKERNDNFITLLKTTINRMYYCPQKEKDYYFDVIDRKYFRRNFELAFKYRSKQVLEIEYSNLCSKKINSKRDDRKYTLLCKKKTLLPYYFYVLLTKIKHIIYIIVH